MGAVIFLRLRRLGSSPPRWPAPFDCPSTTNAAIVMFEDFEDLTVNFTTDRPLAHDGISDYYHIVPLSGSSANPVSPYTNFGGANYFAAEDIDDGGSQPNPATMTFNVNIAGFDNLTFSGLFAAGGNAAGIPAYDNNGNAADDFLRVTAQIDGGAIQNLYWLSPAAGTNETLFVDSDFNGVGNGGEIAATSNFADQSVSNLSIAGTGTNLALRIFLQSNDGNTEFAWDNIRIDGDNIAVPEPSSLGLAALAGCGLIVRRRRKAA